MGYNKRPVRRNALVGGSGVGAIIDLPKNESLMVCGLDAWPDATYRCPDDLLVHEERLEIRLNTTHFRLPAAYDDNMNNAATIHNQIPCIRFPQWHVCPRCGAMEMLGMYSPKNERCKGRHMSIGRSCEDIPADKRPVMNPMRFIAVCEKGHIDDFPYMEWVHKGNDFDERNCKLRMRTSGSSSSLSSVIIECSCGKSRSMAGSFDKYALSGIKKCNGRRPWLGDMENEGEGPCNILQASQRGASNVYFPMIISSIHLPRKSERFDDKIINIVDKKWDFFTSGLVDGKIDDIRVSMAADMFNVDKNQLRKAVNNKAQGLEEMFKTKDALRDDKIFRYQEYCALLEGNDAVWQDFYGEKLDQSFYKGTFMNLISSITLMKKLRETRVQVGFSRLKPFDDSVSDTIKQMRLNNEIDWLPAAVVYGEGIFICFEEKKLEEWSTRAEVVKRIDLLNNRSANNSRNSFTPKFIMMHTLAHLLINQLSFECGYGSSSIRERIYCDSNHPDMPMSGILLYTASGDSEGSLGGLVRQGEPGRFEDILLKALQNSLWCSSDPVCMQSHGQGINSMNLAACHNCCLLPETSCEVRNVLLDRRMVTGELGIWGTLDGYVI